MFDGNLSAQTITSLLTHCLHSQTPTFFEPTSASKSLRVLPFFQTQTQTINRSTPGLAYISPNLLELKTLFHAALEMGLIQKDARPSVDAGSAGEEGWGEAVGDWVKTLGLKWAVDEHSQSLTLFKRTNHRADDRSVCSYRHGRSTVSDIPMPDPQTRVPRGPYVPSPSIPFVIPCVQPIAQRARLPPRKLVVHPSADVPPSSARPVGIYREHDGRGRQFGRRDRRSDRRLSSGPAGRSAVGTVHREGAEGRCSEFAESVGGGRVG